ncbi:MAG: dihydroorotate dehydrogenase-like protein [bacterium]|nr:dihydroorotate dehydrogenase-like protein [bacterium]
MDLSTTFMGMNLKNPIVVSASPLSSDIANIRAIEDVGASAVVLPSLFEELILQRFQEMGTRFSYDTESFAEATDDCPKPDMYRECDEYLEHIQKAKEAVDIPIIGSLNGVTAGGWTDYGKKMEEAGVDALELNVYYIPTDPDLLGSTIEQRYLDILIDLKSRVSVPVAIKLNPYFSSMVNMARRLDEVGVDGLVLFNRFYQSDIDLEALEVVPSAILSTSQAMWLPLRWIAILYGQIGASLAATSGIHTVEDVLKMLMAGAHVTQMCSALFEHGIGHIWKVLGEMRAWMEKHEYTSVKEMQGRMSQKLCKDPSTFEREYIEALSSYK